MIKELEVLVDIEERYGLYTSEIAGVPVWMYIRYLLLREELLREVLKRKRSQNSRQVGPVRDLIRISRILRDDLRSRRNLRQSDILFISHERMVNVDGMYRCIYTDEIARSYRGLRLSVLREDEYRSEAIPEYQLYVGLGTVYGEVWHLFTKILRPGYYRSIMEELNARWNVPLKEMEERLGVTTDRQRLLALAAKRVIMTPVTKRYLSRYLKTIRPRCIVETISYEWNRMLINELAHEQGIPVIELQHGGIDQDHAAYQYGTDIRLPQLPDQLFTFSEFWNKQIHMPGQSTKCVAVGFPFFERQIAKYRKQAPTDENVTRIIFISQPTEGERLSTAAMYCLDHLEKEYQIIYKLHPLEYADWKQRYPALAQRQDHNLRIIDDNRESIYRIQAACKIQVGSYSTAIYEGLGFDLYTIIYRSGRADREPAIVEQGYAQSADSPESLVDRIKNRQRTQDRENGREAFWETNALENMKRELDRVMISREETK